MPAEKNKQLILDYFDVIEGKNTTMAIGDFFSDNAVWHLPQSNTMFKTNPRRGRAAVMEVLNSGVDVYQPGTIRISVDRVIADAESVAAQFTLDAKLVDGKDYSNHYCFVFSIRNGRIDGIWEYLDSLYQSQLGMFDKT